MQVNNRRPTPPNGKPETMTFRRFLICRAWHWALIGLVVAACLPPRAVAQAERDTTVVPDTLDVGEDVESAMDDLDTEAGDPAQILEQLTDLASHPLDINTAPAEDLARIPAFSPLLARRIVAYRQENGAFGSIPEIRAVDGVSQRRFLQARPYLRIGTPYQGPTERPRPYPSLPTLQQVANGMDVEVMHRVGRRLDLGRGYDDDPTRTTFVGSPERLTTRIRLNYDRRVEARLTLDKDPGEAFRWAPDQQTYGYDHVAGTMALHDMGRLKTLVIGDFTAEFGQGVALWRGIGFGKGRDPVSPLLRSGRGLAPFGSTEENRFFRGAGATIRLTPSLSVTAFGSRRSLDASFRDEPVDSAEAASGTLPATTLSISGLHRTDSELDRKDALNETAIGGGVEYVWKRVRVGAAGIHSRFDRPLAPSDRPDDQFDFAGDRATTTTLYGTAYLGDYVLFGEAARSPDGVFGGVAGAAVDIGTRTEAIVMGRAYPRDFVSLHGYGFGERGGATRNEVGVYAGARVQVADDWRVAAYVDQYRFPWLRFAVPRPTSGIEARVVIEHAPRPWLEHYVQLRSETKENGTDRTGPGGRLLDAVQPETRQSIRWNGVYIFSRALTLRTRLEATRFNDPEAHARTGILLYQDVRWRPRPSLRLDTRLAFFDTDGFDARVFAYEYDLLYAFSVPAFFGTGQRFYVLGRYKPHPTLTLEAKYGATRFENVTSVGSGLNETDGNLVREVGVQVRWRWNRE
jgi:hypothetical protein